MKNDAGFLGCAFGLLLFCFISVVAMWRSSPTWQLAITVVAALILLTATRHLGRQGTYKFKIVALLSLCLSLILLFAALYSVVFRNLPESFRLSNEMLTVNVRDEYPEHSLRFLQKTTEHYYLTLMRGRPVEVIRVLRATRGEGSAETGIGVNEVLRVRCSKSRMPMGGPTADMLVEGLECDLEVGERGKPSSFFSLKDVNPPVDNFVDKLVDAETAEEVVHILDAPIKAMERERDASQNEMSKIVTKKTYLEMSHFIYFSAAVMTTVGSNDISPNSQLTRYLVVFQSLTAVFFFGYALHLLWPEKARARVDGGGNAV